MNSLGSVLFVDDEPSILSALKRLFFRSEITIYLAQNAKDGLEILEKKDIDVVVSDYKMDEMNGIEFLKIVREKYPAIYRAILSGYVEEITAINAIINGIANSYITKPWNDEFLKKRIMELISLKKEIFREDGKNIAKLKLLPPIDKTLNLLLEAIEKDEPIKKISSIIKKDISLSVDIIHIANSAFYGTGEINSLEQAIVRLGLNSIKNITVAHNLKNFKKWTPKENDYINEIFQISFIVNKYFQLIYEKKYGKKIDTNSSSVGLLYSIGKIVLLYFFPERYEKILNTINKKNIFNFHEAEKESDPTFISSCYLGGYIAFLWNMSELLIEANLYINTPEKSSEICKNYIEILSELERVVSYIWYSIKTTNKIEKQITFNFVTEEIYNKIKNEIMEVINGTTN